MSKFFIILSGLLTIASVVNYFRQVINGASIPNPSTWLLWAVISIMNATSYFAVVRGNLWQSFYVLIMAVGLTTIFVYSLIKGKFGKFGPIEIVCSILAVLVGILWKTTGNADFANVSLQTIFLISIIPTIYGLLVGELKEKALAWNLAVASHVFAAIGIILSDQFRWIALVYPIVTGIVGNGSVALIVLMQSKGIIQSRNIKQT